MPIGTISDGTDGGTGNGGLEIKDRPTAPRTPVGPVTPLPSPVGAGVKVRQPSFNKGGVVTRNIDKFANGGVVTRNIDNFFSGMR